jgi:hypothetical protein
MANPNSSQNVRSTSPGAGKAKLPKDVTGTPTGKALNDLAKGNQPAGHIYDGQRGNPPPVRVDKSTSTRTPQQAIEQYKNSGPPPGVRIKPAKEPPPPHCHEEKVVPIRGGDAKALPLSIFRKQSSFSSIFFFLSSGSDSA